MSRSRSIVVNEQKPLMVTTPTLCAHTCTCVTLVPRARRGICANAYEQTTALPLLLKKY
jgi:hypothetical protein